MFRSCLYNVGQSRTTFYRHDGYAKWVQHLNIQQAPLLDICGFAIQIQYLNFCTSGGLYFLGSQQTSKSTLNWHLLDVCLLSGYVLALIIVSTTDCWPYDITPREPYMDAAVGAVLADPGQREEETLSSFPWPQHWSLMTWRNTSLFITCRWPLESNIGCAVSIHFTIIDYPVSSLRLIASSLHLRDSYKVCHRDEAQR